MLLTLILALGMWQLFKFFYMFVLAILVWLNMKRRDRMVWRYARAVWVAYDQLWNARWGGDEDETISSRAYKNRDKHWFWRYLYLMLEKIDPGHGKKAYEPDEGKNQTFKL